MKRLATRVTSRTAADFARAIKHGAAIWPCAGPKRNHDHRHRLNTNEVRNGLAQLVLALVKLLHELLERQAIRRMEARALTDAEIDRIGFVLMKQTEQIETLRKSFGLSEEDLNLDLGPLGRLL
jgi:Gas vesicle protein K